MSYKYILIITYTEIGQLNTYNPIYCNENDDVIKWEHFPRYWPFVRGFTGHRWIPLAEASDAELWCFLWSAPEQTVEQTL